MTSQTTRAVFLSLALLVGAAGPVRAGIYDDLLKAIEENDTAKVTTILQSGMDVNTVDPAGNTLLMLAARNGNGGLVRFLLDHRARVRGRNRHGDSALMLAALKGHLEIVKLLTGAGAEINHAGWTPLSYAAFEGHTEIARFLLNQGAAVAARAPNGATALMAAARNGHLETVKLLLNAKADPNATGDQGATALKWAVAAGHGEIAAVLKAAGARED